MIFNVSLIGAFLWKGLREIARAEAAEVDRIDLLEGEGNVCNIGKNFKICFYQQP